MNKKGFTLIELLSIVVILGVTFMYILPKMVSMFKEGEKTETEIIEERVISAARDYVNYIDGTFYTKFYKEGDTNYIYKTDLINSKLIDEEEINKLDTFAGVKGELLKDDKMKYTVEYIDAEPSSYTNEELYLMIQNMSGGTGSGGESSEVIDDLQSQINNHTNDINILKQKNSFLDAYPVGSIYVSVSSTNPGNTFGGTWEQVSQGRALFGAGELNNITYVADTNIEAGLPNITGQYALDSTTSSLLNSGGRFRGAFTSKSSLAGGSDGVQWRTGGSNLDLAFDASLSNSIYGNSQTVQPNAYVVYMWKRIA